MCNPFTSQCRLLIQSSAKVYNFAVAHLPDLRWQLWNAGGKSDIYHPRWRCSKECTSIGLTTGLIVGEQLLLGNGHFKMNRINHLSGRCRAGPLNSIRQTIAGWFMKGLAMD
ncbi:hypothetical protein PGTUg99_021436 [Puccinia graminis f. sp. tritici]|uniref:Uncharacterized protein n=1 Tax=Puccinia graminis f. sp. tritici TaxID=56615 RepID=A0A5B0M9R6_PUCGR|nr:hypothetical protein PGTUg99_021436 [Puccinia graminis f. sp. tritici]